MDEMKAVLTAEMTAQLMAVPMVEMSVTMWAELLVRRSVGWMAAPMASKLVESLG